MQAPRRLQLRRGNTAAVSSYLGAAGELIVNTDTNVLYIHDGITVGGIATSVNVATINSQIIAANVGMQGYVDFSIQANIANIAPGYTDTNVRAYLGAFNGNIIPSANVAYSLGNITHQWRDLFVSNTTIYIGGVPVSIGPSGNLIVNGNTIPTTAYVNQQVANVTVDLSSYALNANVTAANVGLKGYIDQANTIQSAQIAAANVGIIGYIDRGNSIQSAQITAANVGMLGYVNQANTIQSEQITAANLGMKGYVDNISTTLSANSYQQQAQIGNLQASAYSNSNVSAFLVSHTDQTFGGNVTIQGNLVVNGNVSYVSTNNLIINDNIINLADSNPADSLDLGFVAHRTPSGQPLQHTGLVRDTSANQWRLFSNIVTAPGTTVDFTNAVYDDLQVGNITSPTIDAINNNISAANVGMMGYVDNAVSTANVSIIGYIDQGNTIQAAAITAANVGMKGYVDSQSFYSNARVATYLQVGNISNVSVAGNVTATYFIGNGALLTGIVAGSNYSNVQVATFLPTYSGNLSAGGYVGIAGQDGTTVVDFQTGAGTNQIITLGSNYTFSIKAGDGASNRGSLVLESGRNTRVRVNGSSSNVLITAGNGVQSSTWTFANSGVLTFPDGTTMTTASASTYSNVQVATYLPTYSGNIANIRLGVSGILTFADGTTLATASAIGGSTYGNANVASYLITNGYVNTNSAYGNGNVASYLITNQYINANSAYSNANVTSYLPTHSGNVGVNNIIGTTPNVTLQANSYSTTYDIYGNVAFGNAAYPVQISATGNISTSGYLFGNGAFLTGIVASGGGGTNYSNVNLQAYLSGSVTGIVPASAYSNNLGTNVKPWGNFFTYNMELLGGYFKTNGTGGISGQVLKSTGDVNPPVWSNIADIIAATTSQITIANIKLGPSGNIVFADGTVQTTAGGGASYDQTLNTTDTVRFSELAVGISGSLETIIYNDAININGSFALTESSIETFTGNVAANFANISSLAVNGDAAIGNIEITTRLPAYDAVIKNGANATNILLESSNALDLSASGNLRIQPGNGRHVVFSAGMLPGTAQFDIDILSTRTTAATNTTSGALQVAGGAGIAGNLHVGSAAVIGASGYTVLPTTVAQFTGNANTYTQLNLQNISTGSDATAEYVATANNGTDTTYFVDMGIANSNYDVNSPNNSLGTTIFPNDSYLYAQGNLATTTGGNLAIGTTTLNKTVKIFAGGINSSNIIATVSATGLAVTGTLTATGTVTAANLNMGQIRFTGADQTLTTANGTAIAVGARLNLSGSAAGLGLSVTNSASFSSNVSVGGFLTMSNRPAFRIYGNGSTNWTTANTNFKGSSIVVDYNQGSYFNSTTGVFTAPVAGLYSVTLTARIGNNNGQNQIMVIKNNQTSAGNVAVMWECDTNTGTAVHFGVSSVIKLAAGDVLTANITVGAVQFDANDSWTVTYLG